MVDWNRHKLTHYLKLAAEHGIKLQFPQDQQPAKRKYPRWSICVDAIDDDKVGCVQVLLPYWLSIIFLWWKLPKDAFRKLRALRRREQHYERTNR